MKKTLFILAFIFLGGCAYHNPLSDMQFQTTMAPPYVVANWYKITKTGDTLKVYIEGDGHAFNANGQPTDNPTPRDTFMRQLASNDPSSNVAYLSRPCQYLQVSCTQTDWTTGRFSEKVVASLDRVVMDLMKKSKSKQVILIGFSGGAQIAGLIAVRHPNKVKKIITISGVLDHRAWTQYHHVPPLTQSLNLKDYQKQFSKIPQTHYVGGQDTIVPPDLNKKFTPQIIIIPKAEHGPGYDEIYNQIYGER